MIDLLAGTTGFIIAAPGAITKPAGSRIHRGLRHHWGQTDKSV